MNTIKIVKEKDNNSEPSPITFEEAVKRLLATPPKKKYKIPKKDK